MAVQVLCFYGSADVTVFNVQHDFETAEGVQPSAAQKVIHINASDRTDTLLLELYRTLAKRFNGWCFICSTHASLWLLIYVFHVYFTCTRP